MGKYLDIADRALRDMAEGQKRPASPVKPSRLYGEKSERSEISALRGTVIDLDRERRIRAVIERLSECPKSVRYAWEAHSDIDPERVIVSVAVRGKGACELSIARDRWDPFRFLEFIADDDRPDGAA